MGVTQVTQAPYRYVTCADTAKLLRAALKVEFPGVRFYVKSNTYSGGASIDVGWVDGPTGKQVDPVLQRFAGATFDGMIDLKTNHRTLLTHPDGTTELVQFAANFVFARREFTPEFLAAQVARIERAIGRQLKAPYPLEGDLQAGDIGAAEILTGERQLNFMRTDGDLLRFVLANTAGERHGGKVATSRY